MGAGEGGGVLLLLGWGGGLDGRVNEPSPTPALPVPSPVPAPKRSFVSSVHSAVGGVLCYRPDLVSCATEGYIAFRESAYGVGLYNPIPVYIGGVEQHGIGWFGMLWPLHAHHWAAPSGTLDSDTAAFYSLIEEQGLAPWGY